MLKFNTNEFKDETEEQKKIRLKKRDDDYCKMNNLLNQNELDNLTDEDKINILENTVTIIRKYYNDNGMDKLKCEDTAKSFKVYDLTYNHRSKIKYNIKNKETIYKRLCTNEYFKYITLHIDSKNYIYLNIYNFAVAYYKFRKSYIENYKVTKRLIDAINLCNKKEDLLCHFSNELKAIINFQTEIGLTQLDNYFIYNYQDTRTKDIDKLFEVYKKLFKILFNLDVRSDKMKSNITVENPYESLYNTNY